MVSTISEPPGQIPYKYEVARKLTHLGALSIPGGYYFLSLQKAEMLSIMVPAALLMVLIDIGRLRHWRFYERFGVKSMGKMMRAHEHGGDFSGATYILISICLTVALYDKAIAVAALAFIIVGDVCAALIGRKFGRHRFGRKSIEGSLACLAGTVVIALIAPEIPIITGLFGALVATITEAMSTKIDDNISVPIVSGLAMTLQATLTF